MTLTFAEKLDLIFKEFVQTVTFSSGKLDLEGVKNGLGKANEKKQLAYVGKILGVFIIFRIMQLIGITTWCLSTSTLTTFDTQSIIGYILRTPFFTGIFFFLQILIGLVLNNYFMTDAKSYSSFYKMFNSKSFAVCVLIALVSKGLFMRYFEFVNYSSLTLSDYSVFLVFTFFIYVIRFFYFKAVKYIAEMIWFKKSNGPASYIHYFVLGITIILGAAYIFEPIEILLSNYCVFKNFSLVIGDYSEIFYIIGVVVVFLQILVSTETFSNLLRSSNTEESMVAENNNKIQENKKRKEKKKPQSSDTESETKIQDNNAYSLLIQLAVVLLIYLIIHAHLFTTIVVSPWAFFDSLGFLILASIAILEPNYTIEKLFNDLTGKYSLIFTIISICIVLGVIEMIMGSSDLQQIANILPGK